jgi:ABC-2 type transport system permease protein
MIAAILGAQLRSMRWRGRRSNAALNIVIGCAWYGFWCVAAVMAEELARIADSAGLESGLPLALLLVLLYWQVMPVISASMGAGLDMRKLLVYPVPHGKLFLVEVLLRLTTGAEMLLVLTGMAIGLERNHVLGGAYLGAAIVLPLLLYVAFNALLASGLRSLLERLLARRRVREVLLLLLLIGGAAPRMLIAFRVNERAFGPFEPLIHLAALPWVVVTRMMVGGAGYVSLLVMTLWLLAAAWFGRTQFERNLRYDAMAAQATGGGHAPRADSWSERFYRLPSRMLRDPLGAVVEKELRSLVRTPRFRMVFVMGFTFGLVFWVPTILRGGGERNGWLAHNFLVVVSVYALILFSQVTYLNCFGFDRSAAQIYFFAPQPVRQVLVGKNIATLVFVYLEVVILSALVPLLRLADGPGTVLEAFLVVGVCSLYMLAFGNISSVRYPQGMKPERVSQRGRLQGLNSLLLFVALFPVALAYLARYAFDSQLAFGVALALAAGLGLALYRMGLDSAVATATTERERILRELSRGEGPVATD